VQGYAARWPVSKRVNSSKADHTLAPVAELINVAPPKRRDPAEPRRGVSPYSVTRTGPDVGSKARGRVRSLLVRAGTLQRLQCSLER
jgi:hypothetical protein